MARRKVSDAVLLIPAALLAISIGLPVVFNAATPLDSPAFFGFAGLFALLFALAIAAPLFLIAYVWLLAALASRRPVRHDVVGWLLCVPLGLLSTVMVVTAIAFLSLGLQPGGTSQYLWIPVVVGLLGCLGLFVEVMSLVPYGTRVAAASRLP